MVSYFSPLQLEDMLNVNNLPCQLTPLQVRPSTVNILGVNVAMKIPARDV